MFACEVLPHTEILYIRCDSNEVWYTDLRQPLGIFAEIRLIVAILVLSFFNKEFCVRIPE